MAQLTKPTFQLPRHIFFFVCAIATAFFTQTCVAQIIFDNDFDQYEGTRTYKKADLNRDWNSPDWENGIDEKRVKIDSSWQAYGKKGSCLAVKYPKNKYGTKNTGAQWQMELGGTYNEVYLNYSVKFKKGFDFVRGGKLPGLAGGTAPTGNVAANGYNGWTTRMMWRTFHTGNPGSPKQTTTNAISYAKHIDSGFDNEGRIEDETFFLDSDNELSQFKSNRWYNISQRVKMNDPFVANGIIQIWVDDKLVINKRNVEFRNTYALGIDQMYFSTFFGGGWSWRTSKYETAYFDNFLIIAID